MKTSTLIHTESTAHVAIGGRWMAVTADKKYPQKWFATASSIEEVQALITADLKGYTDAGLPVLIITREL